MVLAAAMTESEEKKKLENGDEKKCQCGASLNLRIELINGKCAECVAKIDEEEDEEEGLAAEMLLVLKDRVDAMEDDVDYLMRAVGNNEKGETSSVPLDKDSLFNRVRALEDDHGKWRNLDDRVLALYMALNFEWHADTLTLVKKQQ